MSDQMTCVFCGRALPLYDGGPDDMDRIAVTTDGIPVCTTCVPLEAAHTWIDCCAYRTADMTAER